MSITDSVSDRSILASDLGLSERSEGLLSDDPDDAGATVFPIVDPNAIRQAMVINGLLDGGVIPPQELESLDSHPIDWSGIASTLRNIEARLRANALKRWIENQSVVPKQVELIRKALELARESPRETSQVESAPAPFDLGLIDTATFFAAEYPLEYLVKGLMVKGENCTLGGPSKSLKTSILIDLAISLASGTPFLGRFHIPERVPVGLISVESGKGVIQANAKQVCIERDLPFHQASGVYWGFVAPSLSNKEHLSVLRKTIGDKGLKAILLDPLYLMLLSDQAGIDPKDMFQMGPMLSEVSKTCIEAGATPTLAHHFVKQRADPFAVPEMGDLAFAGIGQFMRQWMLLARRERFDADGGRHAMHFVYGGSMGHGGYLHLDIETGLVDEEFRGRRWVVTTMNPSENIATRQDQSKMQKAMKEDQAIKDKEAAGRKKIERNAGLILEALKSGGPSSLTDLRARTAITLTSVDAKAAMYQLTQQGLAENCEIELAVRGGSTRKDQGYRATAQPGEQGVLDLNPE